MTKQSTNQANQGSELARSSMSPSNKLRQFRDDLAATNNDHGMAYAIRPDGQGEVLIRNLEGDNVVGIPTKITEEQFKQIQSRILPIKETRYMLYELALAFSKGEPIMFEGGTAIGKTFAVDRFAEFLYGPGAKIPDFYCNGQTDVSELMGKYVPAGLKTEELNRINDYLKSEAGVALKAELKSEGRLSAEELWQQAAVNLKIPVQQGSFVFQLGVLPKAMTGTMSEDGVMRDTPDGEGCLLHIQEVGLAAPSVVNALFKVRGEKGKLARTIQVHEDAGRLIKAGKGFFVVFSTNPPEQGFKERHAVDPALARALIWKTLPSELSSDSLREVASRIFRCTQVERQERSLGAILDLRTNTQLAEILGDTALQFHIVFKDKLDELNQGRKQQIPVTIDSLWKVADILQNHQVAYKDQEGIDFVSTVKQAIRSIYIDSLKNGPEIVASAGLADAAKQNKIKKELMKTIDAILTETSFGQVVVDGQKMNRKDAIEKLSERAFKTDAVNEKVQVVKERAGRVVEGMRRQQLVENIVEHLAPVELEDKGVLAQFVNKLRGEGASKPA